MSNWEMFDRGIANPTLLPRVYTVTASIVHRRFVAGVRPMEAVSYQRRGPSPTGPPPPQHPQHGGMQQGSLLRALLMNMYIHHEWLTRCFAYVQPLSSECRLQGPTGARQCLFKLPSLWSGVYLSRSWSAPQVDGHNELWVLIIFLRGGAESTKVGFGSITASVKSY